MFQTTIHQHMHSTDNILSGDHVQYVNNHTVFIELTDAQMPQPQMINVLHIIGFCDSGSGGSLLQMVNGRSYVVRENLNEICELIAGATGMVTPVTAYTINKMFPKQQ